MKEFKLFVLFTIEYVATLIHFGLSLVCAVFHLVEVVVGGIRTGLEKIEVKCIETRERISLTVEPTAEPAKVK